MTYKESFEKAAAAARQALDKMDALQIAPHPDNFEIWYAYHAEIDAELSRKLEEMIEQADDFNPDGYSEIKQSFLGDDPTHLIANAAEKAGSTLNYAIEMIGEASSNARDYGDRLEGFTGDISKAGPAELAALVAKLSVETKDVMTRNASLERELQVASGRIDELRDNLDDARKASETDGLTGLPNRRAYDLCIEAEIERARNEQSPLALIIADVDKFKRFNDTHGHKVGDEVLKLVGRVLRAQLKGSDRPARYGGEEFCIILPATMIEGAVAVAELVRKTIEAKSLRNARTGQSYGEITMSFGCAAFLPGDTSETLYVRADAALYAAKNTGRNRTCTESQAEDQGAQTA